MVINKITKMKTAEEILNEELSDYYLSVINEHDLDGDTPFKNWIIEAMQEYADQFKQKEVTDEDITTAFCETRDEDLRSHLDYRDRDYFQAGYDFAIRFCHPSLFPPKEIVLPSDEDIKNAALDYIDYEDDKDTLKTRYLTRSQYAKEAYMQGAKDCRDNNIYISATTKNDKMHREKEVPLTAEEINHIRVLMQIISDRIEVDGGMNSSDLKSLWNELSDVVTKLDQVSSQFQPKEIVLPSDEEIEKWAAGQVNQIDPDKCGYGDCLIDGAKWLRNLIEKQK
jgi:hypothetical protein